MLYNRGMLERLGAKAPPEPRLFLKPSTSYICSGQPILVQYYINHINVFKALPAFKCNIFISIWNS